MTERLDPYELFADDEWDVAANLPVVPAPRKVGRRDIPAVEKWSTAESKNRRAA